MKDGVTSVCMYAKEYLQELTKIKEKSIILILSAPFIHTFSLLFIVATPDF
jgi:hypothetical protein